MTGGAGVRRPPWPRVLLALALAFGALGAATLRVVWAGGSELAASDEALRQGDPREATVRARRAASWYAPGAPHVGLAYQRLVALARAAEEHKRIDIALLAWRGVRSASLETRWILTPHAADRALAEREIARLSALGAEAPSEAATIEQAQLELLLRHTQPRTAWAAMLVLAFVTAAGGSAWWARRAAGAGGKLDLARARAPAALALLGAILWLLAVWQA